MNREQKAAVVEELTEQIQAADAIFAVDYRGISVSEAAELRVKLRDAGTRFRVVKNSLTERATDKAGADALRPLLEGPTALAFVRGDAALAAKALNDVARDTNLLEFKGGLMNGSALTAEDVRSIARLPAREVLHAQLVGTIASPISGLVRTLNALISGLAVQLGQIADQGLVSGEAPASSSEGPSDETDGEATASPASPSDEDAAASDEDAEAPAPAEEGEAESPPEAAEPEPAAASEEEATPETEADESAENDLEQTESDASADEPQAEEPKEE